MCGELSHALGRATFARRRAQIEEAAAADRALRGGVAQDEAVAGDRGDRAVENELNVRLAARRYRRIAEQYDARSDFGRRMVQPHGHPLADRLCLGGEHAQRRIDALRRRVQIGMEHEVAAVDRILADRVAREIERAALAAASALGGAVLRMDRAHARGKAGRTDQNVIADRDRAG